MRPPSEALEARRARVSRALHRVGDAFHRGFERLADRYRGTVAWVLRRPWPVMGVYALLVAALIVVFLRLPTSFLPVEDQGRA